MPSTVNAFSCHACFLNSSAVTICSGQSVSLLRICVKAWWWLWATRQL